MTLRSLLVRWLAAAVFLASVIALPPARADEFSGHRLAPETDPAAGRTHVSYVPTPAPYASPLVDVGVRVERVWYGHELIVVDATAALMAYGAIQLEQPSVELGWAAAGTYVFGGSVVHLANGEVGRALGSFALRTSLPLAGSFIGLAFDSGHHCRGDVCFQNTDGFYWGGVVGMVSAVLLDDVLLAHKVVRNEPSWAPMVSRSHAGSLTFGLGGSF